MMLGLISNSPTMTTDALKVVLPFSVGLASAAFLTMKILAGSGFSQDKSIPIVALRPGDSTHDDEYNEDPDAFLKRCLEGYGPIFNIYFMNKSLTVVSEPQMIRDVFLQESFSASDSIDELTGMRTFLHSMTKSNHDLDNRTIHDLVTYNITPNLPLFTPRIVEQLESHLEKHLGACLSETGGKLIEKPISIIQEAVAHAMANVFVGPEIAKSRKVIDAFISATADFGKMIKSANTRTSSWRTFLLRTELNVLNPLQVHVRTIVEAATPVILERRRQEAEAIEKGGEYKRPDDILQRMLDNFDKYNFVDLEDLCGHVLILVLASVHTTTETSTNMLYYLGAFSEHMDRLYDEQRQVLDSIQQERESRRQELLSKGGSIDEDLDPAHDRDLSAAAIKKMVATESFIREMMRYRTDRLTLMHRARKDVRLSSGFLISKGSTVIINMHSAHHGPEQGEDVAEFRPWRFVGQSKAATKVGADYLPFGMGRHACPGRFLAIQELKTIAVLIVSRFSRIEVEDPTKTKRILRAPFGTPADTGLIFTSRS
ncbi:hypothetical protein BGX28_002506 [Mortierella sp. GBA30]|nr:hypothetical protein BGX28_002506 [Mortierella sp. GBA30]